VRAFLLAAGLGTRLRPLTDTTPKCLLPIGGRPLLFHWLDLLERDGVSDVLINTHHLSEMVAGALALRPSKIKVELFHEPTLLGSAGTIRHNRKYVFGEEDFLVLYADNLTDVSLSRLIEFHRSRGSLFTTYVYETQVPSQKGIFLIDETTGKVIDFEEKPRYPKSNLANAGIAIANMEIFDYFIDQIPLDLGFDVMRSLVGHMYALKSKSYIRDIGTIEDYGAAEREWAERKHSGL